MAPSEIPSVSPAEAQVLQLLCQSGRATVLQIVDALPMDRSIGYATVQTLLRRLEKKGYISHEVQGKAHVFFPKVRHDEAVGRSVRDFVNRLFGGDPMQLMLHLAGSGKLKKKDLDRLRELLNKSQS
jgi:predicted transcriptional regulator